MKYLCNIHVLSKMITKDRILFFLIKFNLTLYFSYLRYISLVLQIFEIEIEK